MKRVLIPQIFHYDIGHIETYIQFVTLRNEKILLHFSIIFESGIEYLQNQ